MVQSVGGVASRALRLLRPAAGVATLAAAAAAQAQFATVPAPQCKPPVESNLEDERAYRVDASRHLYACFPMRVYRGKLPPLLHGVMIVETEVDAQGHVVDVTVRRGPAAAEVGPWVVAMIRRAAPFPAPARLPGARARFTEIFLVDKSGLFQTDSLTEGQR